jgi:hypothetical protein
MRLTAIVSAVALMTAAAFSYPAQAYCRGCAMSPQASAAAAAAAVAGATYGATMMPGANAQAYEPMPDSTATYRPAASESKTTGCANGTRRSWSADSDAAPAHTESCD